MIVPQIDILIPVHNAEATLDAALESLAEQTFRDFRVIAVDDGSTDGCARILARWQEKDPRFMVVRQDNAGIVSALNHALALVEAPFVARMDADDICLPDRLAQQHSHLQAHPGCVGVGCKVDHIDEHGAPVPGLPQPGDPMLADAAWVPVREPYIVHPFLMARTDAMRKAGGYRAVPHSEDSDLYWRLREAGELHNLPIVLGQYRFHVGSISGSSVVNGRIMAIGSQLGGLAARRRARGEAEPDFSGTLIAQLRSAGTLDAMCTLVGPILAPLEVNQFRLSVGIKLLELSAYRPYEIERSDCAFIAAALRDQPPIAMENAREVRWYVSQASARLIKAGHVGAAMLLTPVWLWPTALAKSLWR